MSGAFTDSILEDAALAWLKRTGWPVIASGKIAPDERRYVYRRSRSSA